MFVKGSVSFIKKFSNNVNSIGKVFFLSNKCLAFSKIINIPIVGGAMWNNFINDSISRLSSEQSLETYSFVKHVGEKRD